MTKRPIIALFMLLSGCASPKTPSTAESPDCETRLRAANAVFPKPAAPSVPASRVVVELRAPVQRIQQVLARNVPVVLAEAKRQPIGAAGFAAYRVQRGQFSIAIEEERLIVTTPVRAHIEVSKNFGPITVKYGKCDPELLARVTVPLRLGKNFEPGAPAVSAKIERGCKIAGFDVSGQIQNEARRQTEQLERKIREALAFVPQIAKQAFRPFSLRLANERCLMFRASELRYELPRIENGLLLSRVALLGEAQLSTACDDDPEALNESAAMPEPSVVSRLDPESALSFHAIMPYEELSAALTERARNLPVRWGSRITNVQARSFADAGTAKVALGVALDGRTCGAAWLEARPAYDTASRLLAFRDIEPAPGQLLAPAEALLRKLAAKLGAPLPPKIMQELEPVRSELDMLRDQLLPIADGMPYLKSSIAPLTLALDSVAAGPEALELFVELRTQAIAELE